MKVEGDGQDDSWDRVSKVQVINFISSSIYFKPKFAM